MIPRQYQLDAVNSLWKCWKMSPNSRPLIVAPTGAGKSFLIGLIIQKVITARPDYKILVLAHRKELVYQNAMEISNMIGQPVGLYSAGLRSKQMRQITSAGIQSIYNKKPTANLVIIDECHLFSGEDTSMYGKLLASMDTRVVGLTATCYRTDQGSLVGDGAFFTDIAYDIGVRELIDNGYLCPLISKPTQTVDMTGVSRSGWDYNATEAAERFLPSVLEHCKSLVGLPRKHWLIFATGVKHAHMVADCLCSLGVAAKAIDGNMLAMERDLIIADFKAGRITALVNCEILTTGFNFPAIDLIVLLRATKSTSLYVQIVGRGMRTAAGKSNCLVLDFGGNISRHGPIDAIEVKRKPKGGLTIGCAPVKECPKCGAVSVVRTLTCSCGYEFPLATTQISKVAETAPILSEVETLEVQGLDVKIHKKEKNSLKIEFRCGLRYVTQFLCFDHGFFPAQKARKTWAEMTGNTPPKSVEEAFSRQRELRKPHQILVVKEGKYDRILGCVYGEATD